MSSLAEIQELIHTKYGIDPATLDPNASMRGAGIDSLALVEFLFEVEDRYGIRVDDMTQFQQMTLNEVVAHMEQVVRDKHGGLLPEPVSPEKAVI